MAYLRTLMLIALAVLPFAISYFLKTSKDLQRRNIFYRCIKSLDNFLTKWNCYKKFVLFIDRFKQILPKNRNARKFFLYVTGLIIVTYHSVDYYCYIKDCFGIDYLSLKIPDINMEHTELSDMFPIRYLESILLTLPLAYYPAGNYYLLSLQNCDDRLFFIVCYTLLALIYVTNIDVLCVTIYLLMLAGSLYPNEISDQGPGAKEPLRRISKYKFKDIGDVSKAA